MQSKKMLICMGLPGSGKSTMVKEIVHQHYATLGDELIICSADDYWIRPDGLYDWNFKNIGLAHKWCQEKCRQALEQDLSLVIIDNTNLTAKERQPYIDMAAKYGYAVEIKEPSTEWKYNALECYKRNTHGVPLATIDKMLAKLVQDKTANAGEKL